MIPAAWLDNAKMDRIVNHWTAGRHNPTEFDKRHYHVLIPGSGGVTRGLFPIKANEKPSGSNYAAHTRNCNTRSIGQSLACMADAVESPFYAGPAPMTEEQWRDGIISNAELCLHYGIKVSRETLLSHAEVEPTLKIKQRAKWDYTRIAFDPKLRGAIEIGDRWRDEVVRIMKAGTPKPTLIEVEMTAAANKAEGAVPAMALHGFTQASTLNFRKSPGGAVVGRLPYDTRVAIVDVDDTGWYEVRTPAGYVGWVSADFVTLAN